MTTTPEGNQDICPLCLQRRYQTGEWPEYAEHVEHRSKR